MAKATNEVTATATARYRTAETNLWTHYGAAPTERFIDLPSSGTRVRVQELGDGPPLLFIHGGPNAGSTFAPAAAVLPEWRCLILDRPGCGLSGPADYDAQPIPELAVDILSEALDRLGIDRIDLVGSSFGGSWAMWFAAAHPDRVGRLVLLGAPAFVPEMAVPGFVKLMQAPVIGSLIAKLPPSIGSTKRIYGQLGHSKEVVEDKLPDAYWEWAVRLMADTDTMASDSGAMARTISRRGSHPDVEFTAQQLGAIAADALLYWGDADPFGGVTVARIVARLIPSSSLEVVNGGGHLPWLDDPNRAATTIRGFLHRGSATGDRRRTPPRA